MGVRTARPADAHAIALVSVRAWQRAYRGGLMPDDFLDRLSVADRTSMWERLLTTEAPPRSACLVADDAGIVLGFIAVGPEDGAADAARGEVYAINVDPDHWRTGVGGVLLAAGCARLQALGFAEAVLWVHAGNARACAFYAAKGWTPDGAAKRQQVLGVEIPEVRYRSDVPAPTGARTGG